MSEQIPGVPEGYRLVRIGRANPEEIVLDEGVPTAWRSSGRSTKQYAIVERIEKPKQYEFVVVIPADGIDPDALGDTAAAVGRMLRQTGGTVTFREKGAKP